MSESAQSEELTILESEIARFGAGRLCFPRFTRRIENRYLHDAGHMHARALWRHGLMALAAYDFFLVGDFYMAPAQKARALLVRLGILTPLALLVGLGATRFRQMRAKEAVSVGVCLAAALSILFLYADASAVVFAEAQCSIMLVLLSINCMLQIELIWAFAATLLIFFADVAVMSINTLLSTPERMVSAGTLFWVAVLTVVVNYSLTRERRHNYLLLRRDSLHRSLLASANAELVALSSTDRLTNLPNRRAYDQRLQELWDAAVERKEPLSVIMADVDHFKQLNDTFGHPYGDRVLQRIALLLNQALREEDDFVARFGGEEFIVLLPNTTPEAALKVAERMRTLVHVAGSPALQRDTAQNESMVWSTISCGVATAWPRDGESAAVLVADADAAMYRAKQTGRNRVCSAPPVAAAVPPMSAHASPWNAGRTA